MAYDESRGSLLRATTIGAILQLAMVLAGHYSASVANAFAVGGMTISAVAGLLYATTYHPPTAGSAAKGGAIAGGVSAFVGILVSYLLGDVSPAVLGYGTVSSAVTGVLGALAGRSVARRRAA